MKNLLEKFNNEKNFIVITTYPSKKLTYNNKGGLYSFGKNFVKNLIKQSKNKIIIFAQKDKNKKIYLENKNILVIKIIKKNSLISFLEVLKTSFFKLNRVKKIIIQFEFNSFGGIKSLIGILLTNFIFNIFKKDVYLILHQVEPDLNNLYGHLGWKKNSLKSKIFSFFIRIYYFLISNFSKKIIVLEEVFKKRLINLRINKRKIFVVPHGVDNEFKIKKNNRNKSLLYFGFLSWYKGVDWLIDNIKNNELTIAGGPSPNLKQKKHYKNFLKELLTKIQNKKNINLTGFVKENKIKDYFYNSQIVVLPYRTMFSSSGPLSFCFSFEKPFILSRPLEDYFESPDFQEALKETGLKKEDFLFDFNPESFEKRLSWARKNLDKLSAFSKIMKQKRSWGKVVKMYLQVLTVS